MKQIIERLEEISTTLWQLTDEPLSSIEDISQSTSNKVDAVIRDLSYLEEVE